MSIKTIKIEAGKDLKGNSVEAFEIGETAITQSQWCSVTGSLPQAYLDIGGEFDPQKPVTHVSYHDAEKFCKKLSEQTGENYRLPTGQEWEFACRAGTTGDFSCPEEDLEDFAVFNQESIADVATKLPNNNGLYDMHGNVWEWTQD